MFDLSQYKLNFNPSDLVPFMSEQTIQYHYGKHLDTYIKNLNSLIENTELQDLDLISIIKKSAGNPQLAKVFNNAAQVFNHNFFFAGLKKDSETEIPEEMIRTFGSKENFFTEFKNAAAAVFGSGWAWLVRGTDSKLKITTTQNAMTPIVNNEKPILVLDVWEHAYYLDYQNRRADFIDAFLSHLVNWDVVSQNLKI